MGSQAVDSSRNTTICFCDKFFTTASLCRSYTLFLDFYLVALVSMHSSALQQPCNRQAGRASKSEMKPIFITLNMLDDFYEFFLLADAWWGSLQCITTLYIFVCPDVCTLMDLWMCVPCTYAYLYTLFFACVCPDGFCKCVCSMIIL